METIPGRMFHLYFNCLKERPFRSPGQGCNKGGSTGYPEHIKSPEDIKGFQPVGSGFCDHENVLSVNGFGNSNIWISDWISMDPGQFKGMHMCHGEVMDPDR